MKNRFAFAIAAVWILLLTACSGTEKMFNSGDHDLVASPATQTSAPKATANAKPDFTAQDAQGTSAHAPLKVAGLKGPTTMGLVNLIEGGIDGAQPESDFEFTMYGAADEIVPLLIKGELDAAAMPANLAATLYQKTEGAVQIACVNTLGVLYVLESGDNIHTVADLKGATILSTGKATTPEYVLRYILNGNGINPDSDVTLSFVSEATEAAARLTATTQEDPNVVAVLPEPYVTGVLAQGDGRLHVALDLSEEWNKVAGSKLVTGVLLVRKEAVEKDPERFENFLAGYQQSVYAANHDLAKTAQLCEKYGIVAKADLALKALPACNICFETGSEMKTDVGGYLQVLFDFDPESIGGALPADDFYYGV